MIMSSVNYRIFAGYSALYFAAKAGDVEIVKSLIAANASLDIRTSWGM